MISAFSGLALIGVIVLVGWAVRRWAGLPGNAEFVLGRLAFSALTLLEIATTGHAPWRTVVTTPLRNPLIIGVALGAVLALTGWHAPAVLADPVSVIGQAAVPVVLIAFGMSLSGRGVLMPGSDR